MGGRIRPEYTLLQGLAICGRCGRRMSVRYHRRGAQEVPDYTCARDRVEKGQAACQIVPGGEVDAAVATLLLSLMTTTSIEVTLAGQAELAARAEEADQLRLQHVEPSRYESELSRRRFMNVDPENRLVADSLEAGCRLE
ncbi:MAG: hypothetical protein ACI80V_000138 [Rhodothermales bacterium]|jgi:hypothetical protein